MPGILRLLILAALPIQPYHTRALSAMQDVTILMKDVLKALNAS